MTTTADGSMAAISGTAARPISSGCGGCPSSTVRIGPSSGWLSSRRPQSVSPKCTSFTVANRHSSSPGWTLQRADLHAVEDVGGVGLELVVAADLDAVVDDGDVVADRGELDRHGQYQGRSRRAATGRAHHRPLHRQPEARAIASPLTTVIGRGHVISTAATIAAASSSLGTGDSDQSGMFPCLRRGSSSRLVRSRSKPAISLARVSDGSITSST